MKAKCEKRSEKRKEGAGAGNWTRTDGCNDLVLQGTQIIELSWPYFRLFALPFSLYAPLAIVIFENNEIILAKNDEKPPFRSKFSPPRGLRTIGPSSQHYFFRKHRSFWAVFPTNLEQKERDLCHEKRKLWSKSHPTPACARFNDKTMQVSARRRYMKPYGVILPKGEAQ